MRRFDGLLRRIAKMEPAPTIPLFLGLESLSDAELDERIKHSIRRFEEKGILPDFLHQESSCDSCTGNGRVAWCYSWQEDELQICSPKATGP